MKNQGIRSKLLAFFLSLMSVVFVVVLTLGILHTVIVDRYNEVDTNIFNQNALINTTSQLVLSYNVYRNAPTDSNLTLYDGNKKAITDIFGILDKSIVNDDSKLAYAGARNTINSVIADTDAGVVSIKNDDIEGTSQKYNDANRKLDFVKQNVASLLLIEINHSAELQAATARIGYISMLVGGVVTLVVFLLTIIVAIAWSKQIISPLLRLDSVAKKISEGNIDADVDEALIKSQDEVGSLSRSFNVMIRHLRENLNALKQSNQETAKARDSAEGLVVVRTKELTEERSRLLASINSLSFGFLIVDISHKVILKNRAVMELFGFGDADVVTVKRISDVLGGFNIEEEAERCLKGKVVCEMKEIIYDKKILRGIVAPIMAKNGSDEKIGYVLLLEDITEAKVMQRSRDEFFAVASHELRTPLTAIRGNAEMILESFAADIKNGDMKEMLVDIEGASVRLIGIVNDFLEVSSFEQGKVQIKNEAFDITTLIAKIERDLSGVVAKKNVALTYIKPDFTVPQVMADKARTEQVIVNLIGNSLKFTEKGSITIALSLKEKFLKVTIVDTGLGISEKYQSRLFRKFQQAGEDMIARDVTQGTGLGLYICQLIVNAMGGTIELEKSELGKGSTFAFTLLIAK